MATTPPFKYQPMFEKGKDTTEYYLLTKDYVSVSEFEGKPILKIEKEGLTAMANAAFRDVSFMLRRSHNEQVAKILSDPEASDNDKYVALTFLRNAEVASKGVLPFCQDTGTAIIHGEKGQQVWTGYCDEEALSLGVYKTYTEENLRYSQNAPLTMYDEVNTKCNLPAQIDIEATEGMEYEFLCVTKGGGSANKTYLYQETKAILNPGTLVPFLIEKIKTLGTAACPPYHIAFVIGGTSAEKNLLTVKLASTHFYDNLPTTGNEFGRAFRDVELEKEVLKEAHRIGLGAQFGGKYLAHDIRIIRLPRHGASCPVGLGVSCSADRNIKCKINKDGIWIEKLDSNPGELIPAELRKAGEGDVVKIDLNQPMENILKGKNDYFKAQYKKLYNSIFPDSEDTEKADKTVTVKSAANSAAASADALADYANGLGFNDKVDTETASKKIQSFVDDYNDMIGALSESENQSVLQKGVIMVNTAKVYSSALKRAGVTVGSDNKLSFDKDKLTDIKAYEFKSTFGRGGFASKVTQKAEQIKRLQGSSGGLFSYSNAVTPSYTYNIGAMFSTYA